MKKLLVGVLALTVGQAFAANCDIQRDNYGNYYVSKDGRKVTNSKRSVSAAYQELEDLERYGMCRDGRRADRRRVSECELKRDNYGNFFVARDGARFTTSKGSVSSAMGDFRELQNYGLCLSPVSQGVCELERDNYGNYFVALNGQRMTSSKRSINIALNDKLELVRSNICVDEVARGACEIERDNYGNYYVSRSGKRMTSSRSSISNVIKDREDLINASMCFEQVATSRCEIERDNYGNFYVSVNGKRMTNSVRSIQAAGDKVSELESANMCYTNAPRTRTNRSSETRRRSQARKKIEIATRTKTTPVVTEVTYDHNEYRTCYERPRTRLVTYTDQRQANRGRKKVVGGLIGVIGGQLLGKATGNENLGDAVSAVGAAVAVYGAVEVADASEIIYQDNGYDCRSYYQVDRRVYKHRVERQRCETRRYYSNRWGAEHEYFETTCSGRRYMTFERNTEIWYN